MDKFDKKYYQRIKYFQKNTLHDWYGWIISSLACKRACGWCKPKRAKNVYGRGNIPGKLKIQKQFEEDDIIKN